VIVVERRTAVGRRLVGAGERVDAFPALEVIVGSDAFNDDDATLHAQADFLKANPKSRLTVQGNTDERGGSEYNLALGQKRAEAVVQQMKVLGVGDSQLEAVSYGKERPAVDGHDESAWAKNRRVELRSK